MQIDVRHRQPVAKKELSVTAYYYVCCKIRVVDVRIVVVRCTVFLGGDQSARWQPEDNN